MATETDPGNALRVILHEAIDLAGAERGFVVLTPGDRLDFALAEKLDWSEVEDPSFEISRTLVREVGTTGRAAFLSLADLPSDHPMSASLGSRGVHAVACVPMVGSAGTVGVLYLDRRNASGSFGGARRGVLELFAAGGPALERARRRFASGGRARARAAASGGAAHALRDA
jgi:GAF domain-containing protein